MVTARSQQEAVDRVSRAYETERMKRPNVSSIPSGRFSVMPNGECIGPTWGAIVTNYSDANQRSWFWGGGCGKTPAEAIEAAFAACAQKRPPGCENGPSTSPAGLNVHLALSGSTSWDGGYCPPGASCDPSTYTRFGSFNAWTYHYNRGRSYVNNARDSIEKLGKECDAGSDPSRPCYTLSTKIKCYNDTPIPQLGKLCTDAALTRNGYTGPLRAER
jgi:hypothetical protein